jgi:GT2 family glycosyltransferase
VTRDRAEIVSKSILSALSQQDCSVRVAVIDDGSADATSELSKQFPSVAWERWSRSRGYLAARNHLMESASEDYFVSLDDDAWFLEGDEIAMAIRAMGEDPKVGAVAFDILSPDRPNSVPRDKPRPAAPYFGCGHVLRLSAVRAVGLYEESPGGYGGEEKDYCLRMMDVGYKTIQLPGVHVWHHKTPLARELSAQYRSGVSNDLALTFRRTPLVALPLALPLKFLQHFGFALRRGWLGPCFAGFRLFFVYFPKLLRSRRAVKIGTLLAYMRLSRGMG